MSYAQGEIQSPAPAPAPLQSTGITRLALNNFRSYPQLVLEMPVHSVILTGPNGAGKTNLLEAISLLSPGRGLRGGRLSEHTNFKAPLTPWSVALQITSPFGIVDLGTASIPLSSGDKTTERRQVHIQQMPAKQEELTQYLSMLWLTPQMDLIFSEGSSTRRRFFDRLVYGLDRSHASRILKYEHLVRERMKLLKSSWASDNKWLSSLEEQLAAASVAIGAVRLSFLKQLQEAEHWALGIFPIPGLGLTGDGEDLLQQGSSALTCEEALQARLRESRSADLESGRTHLGAHRTDFRVTFMEKNCPAEYCSTGEQKAMLIAIIMAACRLQVSREQGTPILLLDEIVAHLDPQRRSQLFQEIMSLNVQAWMTGTEARFFEAINNRVTAFAVQDGKVF